MEGKYSDADGSFTEFEEVIFKQICVLSHSPSVPKLPHGVY